MFLVFNLREAEHLVFIFFSSRNPTPGIVINRPNGTDVYKGVPKDYTGEVGDPVTCLVLLFNQNCPIISLGGRGLWCRMWLQRTSWPCWKVTSQKSKGAQEKSLKGKWINLTQQTPPNYQVLWVLLTFYNSSLGSGPNDHIFVYFTDHGAPGLLAFPDDEVTFLTLTFTRVTSRLCGNKLIWSCSAGLVW